MQRLLLDHLAGVARGVVHGAHPRALLGRGVLEQRPEDLHGDVARQQRRRGSRPRPARIRRRRDARELAACGGICGGNELLRRRDLRDHRAEAREEQRRDVELAGLEQREDLLADRVGVGEAELRARRAARSAR